LAITLDVNTFYSSLDICSIQKINMLNSKLVSLLQTFSKYELNRFRKYLESPFFNENQQLLQFYDLLIPSLKNSTNEQQIGFPSKQDIWSTLFPKKLFKDVKYRRLSSDLTKHAYSFLAFKRFKQSPLVEKTFLLEALNDSALTKQYERVSRSLLQEQETGIRDAEYYYYQHLIYDNQYQFKAKQRIGFLEEFQLKDQNLDCYYFLSKLKNYCAELGNKNFMSIEQGIKVLPNLFAYLENENFLKIPSIKAYYLVAKMLETTDEDGYFFELKTFLFEEIVFSKTDLNELFTHLMNYCVVKINKGNSDFYYQLFDLYKEALQKEVIIEKEQLDFQHYKNIISIGLKVKEYTWVEQFIQDYTQFLRPDKRENALNHNLANLYFSQKKYTQVIEQLSTVTYKSHVYALGGKTILLKTYFELKEYQALDSLIDSFRIYIRRNKLISRAVQQQYLNMLRFVKKIVRVLPNDRKGIKNIKEQVEKCKTLMAKKWILEKVEEFN